MPLLAETFVVNVSLISDLACRSVHLLKPSSPLQDDLTHLASHEQTCKLPLPLSVPYALIFLCPPETKDFVHVLVDLLLLPLQLINLLVDMLLVLLGVRIVSSHLANLHSHPRMPLQVL